MITIEHPTNSPNFSILTMGDLSVAFSYQTPVGFWYNEGEWLVCRNYWGPTTGRHLNRLDGGDKKNRLDLDSFHMVLETALRGFAGELMVT